MGGGESAVLPSISTAQVPHVPSPRQLIRRALPLCGLTRPLRRQAVRRISPSAAEKVMSGFAEADRKVIVCSFRQAAGSSEVDSEEDASRDMKRTGRALELQPCLCRPCRCI